MTSILIRNVTAITLDDEDRILHDVDIVIAGGTIVGVGRNLVFAENRVSEPIEVIDGREQVAHAATLGLFDLPESTLVAHCNVVTEDDLALLAEKGTWVAHAPKTYQKLAMEMPPVARMLEHGVNLLPAGIVYAAHPSDVSHVL